MRSKTIWALGFVNVLLLACLFARHLVTPTHAQVARIPAPSEYLMVSGEIQGVSGGVVFMIDTRNNWMAVRALNQNKIVDFAPIDLARAFK